LEYNNGRDELFTGSENAYVSIKRESLDDLLIEFVFKKYIKGDKSKKSLRQILTPKRHEN
jgi:hypothetical protein